MHMRRLIELQGSRRDRGVHDANGSNRSGRRRGCCHGLLVAGSVASQAANVAVAEPALMGLPTAACPSFALRLPMLLTHQIYRSAVADHANSD